jgi:hypothetical protein
MFRSGIKNLQTLPPMGKNVEEKEKELEKAVLFKKERNNKVKGRGEVLF